MKHLITIQRLCLFLLVFLLAAPAWSKSETWKARDRKKREVEGTRTSADGIVTVTWSDCKTGPALTAANRNWVMKNGSSVTISCKDGWRVRGFRIREQLENPTYINCVDDNRYKKTYYGSSDETHEKSLNISCWDAPSQDIRIEAINDVEFAVYEIDYVKAVSVGFKHSQYNVYSMSGWITPEIISNGHTGNVRYSLENNGTIAKVLDGGKLHIMRPGKGVFTVTYLANGTYAKSEGSTTINVMRDKVTFSKKNEVNLISCGDDYGIFELFNHNTSSHRDYNTNNGGFSVTSSNPNVIKFDGRLRCGSKAGEVTITIKQAQNDYYEAASFSQTFYVIRRDRNGAMLIKDADEWKLFCKLVNEKGMTNLNARLDGDVNLGGDIVMVGTSRSYSGTFDGQEHALKINWNSGDRKWIAPFQNVDGATIKNLRTEGEINSNTHFLSGLICNVYGTTTISGCVSAVNITSTYNGSGCDAAGMIECVWHNAKVTITDCVVKGKFNATTEKGKRYMAGFVNNQYGTCTLTNCLYAGENNCSRGYTFCTNSFSGTTLNNCYYLNACGEAQGTPVTKEQLRNGYVAYKLQAGRGEYTIWGQDLDSDAQPMPTNAPLKMVYEVKFSYKGQVRTTRYANRGKGIYGSLPTAKEILGSNFNPQDTYNFTFSGKFTTSTPITADRTVIVTILINNCYMIGSKEEWKEFCELVKDGQTNLDAKMTADINLGTDIAMVGNNEYSYAIVGSGRPYTGTFDGQGHTLNVSWYPKEGYKIAPFQSVNNATIKNLCVTGNINSEMDRGIFGGLISNADGNTTITNCITDMRLTIKDGDVGGMVCEILGGSLTMTKCVTNGVITLDNRGYGAGMIYSGYNASITMTDCLVKVFFRPSDWARLTMSGFIYSLDYKNEPTTKPVTLNNCLYLGAGNVTQLYGPLRTFAPEKYTTLNNCYHLNKCGETPQGTQVTEKQLKSGEITKLLQNNRTDVCHWAQVLGEMPNLYHAPDKSRTNYVYYDEANSRWTCEDFRLTDGTPLPIGLDFLAVKATYERPFSSKNNATVCLPYELPRNGSFDVHTLSGGQGSKVYFKPVNDKLEAYRPYYITANGTPQLGGTNLQVKAFHDDNLKTTTGTGHSITGTVDGVDNATAAAANAYILQDDGLFHKVTTEHSDATVPAYRAYIICPKASGAKELSIIIDGETTGIDGMTDDAAGTKDGPVYDLQGRRVADRLDDAARHQLPAGVYIVNGRKVVVK
ncbi:hypothetical protein HMPREF0663_12050 [Hoylesella oralis ATCC 33269]|uniref:Peptidase M26 n=1 Tax=Hoylesella oralis ATCC 33269 TaxID=873533 RepID=E7RTH7_9BACT|nr:hypothetical protein [Hoylesella oralis]EFZ35983.1 hypothetical protein HMPREF0663_12050 [Hoylesella oralis ATCC 33269]SHF62608.1 hypothetical protein SAMN05444288_1119 [Hoylesella oralis]